MLLSLAFAAAIALFFSHTVRFRISDSPVPLLLPVWMFTTIPVVYSLQSVPVRFRRLYLLDPIAGPHRELPCGTTPSAARPTHNHLRCPPSIAFQFSWSLPYAYFNPPEPRWPTQSDFMIASGGIE